jgi:hypothetical protein
MTGYMLPLAHIQLMPRQVLDIVHARRKLEQPGYLGTTAFQRFKVNVLRQLCRHLFLPEGGSKPEVILRLFEHVSRIHHYEVVLLTKM